MNLDQHKKFIISVIIFIAIITFGYQAFISYLRIRELKWRQQGAESCVDRITYSTGAVAAKEKCFRKYDF